MQTWLGFPFVFIMTTGVLQAIPEDLYEAATIDGANFFQKFRSITLPLVLYSIAPILITQYTFNFNNFNIIYLFNGGGRLLLDPQRGHRHLGVLDLQTDDAVFSICTCCSCYDLTVNLRHCHCTLAV